MAKLSYNQRSKLPARSFVFKKQKKYPVTDATHARNALARVSQFGSPAEKAKVRSVVRAKYPTIKQKK